MGLLNSYTAYAATGNLLGYFKYSVDQGSTANLDYLLRRPASALQDLINSEDTSTDLTPLEYVITLKNNEILAFILPYLQNKAAMQEGKTIKDTLIRPNSITGLTPVEQAIQTGDTNLVKTLLNSIKGNQDALEAVFTYNGGAILDKALKSQNKELLTALSESVISNQDALKTIFINNLKHENIVNILNLSTKTRTFEKEIILKLVNEVKNNKDLFKILLKDPIYVISTQKSIYQEAILEQNAPIDNDLALIFLDSIKLHAKVLKNALTYNIVEKLITSQNQLVLNTLLSYTKKQDFFKDILTTPHPDTKVTILELALKTGDNDILTTVLEHVKHTQDLLATLFTYESFIAKETILGQAIQPDNKELFHTLLSYIKDHEAFKEILTRVDDHNFTLLNRAVNAKNVAAAKEILESATKLGILEAVLHPQDARQPLGIAKLIKNPDINKLLDNAEKSLASQSTPSSLEKNDITFDKVQDSDSLPNSINQSPTFEPTEFHQTCMGDCPVDNH